MAYAIDNKGFQAKVKAIKGNNAKLRDMVQDALIAATYLCVKDSGNTQPFNDLLDAVGTSLHRKGVTAWAETFAPVVVREGKFVLNKPAFKGMDRESIVSDFSAYIAETGMDAVMWWDIAKDSNKTESIFDAGKAFEALAKKLEANDQAGLAAALRKAHDDFVAAAQAVAA